MFTCFCFTYADVFYIYLFNKLQSDSVFGPVQFLRRQRETWMKSETARSVSMPVSPAHFLAWVSVKDYRLFALDFGLACDTERTRNDTTAAYALS